MNNEEEKASKKKLMEDFAQDDFPMDGLEVTPTGRLRVKYGTVYDWAREHGFTPMDEVFKRLGNKYFGGDVMD